jgi:hypothetical protein
MQNARHLPEIMPGGKIAVTLFPDGLLQAGTPRRPQAIIG